MRRVRVTVKQLKEPIELFSPLEISRTMGVETKPGISDPSRRPWITAGNAWNNSNLYILDGWDNTYGYSRQLADLPTVLGQLDMLRWLVRLHEMFRHAYLNPDFALPQINQLHRIIRPNVPEHINAQMIRNAFAHQILPRLNHVSPVCPGDGRPCVPLAMGIALAFVQNNPRIIVLPGLDTRYAIVRMASWDLSRTTNPDDIEPDFEEDEAPRPEDEGPF